MNNTDDIEAVHYQMWILYRVKFSLLFTLAIPTFFLSLLIFYFFLKNRAISQVPQNYALLILLVVNFIQLSVLTPFSIHFYALGSVHPATPFYCTLWTFLLSILYVISEYLMATISIQRHMLVFHSHVLRIRWMRILFHHSPLLFCLIYPTTFYTLTIFAYHCDGTQWDYTKKCMWFC